MNTKLFEYNQVKDIRFSYIPKIKYILGFYVENQYNNSQEYIKQKNYTYKK